MSHIPNSAMPHAGPGTDIGEEENSPSLFGGAGRLAEKARENPRTSIAAGAAVIAGAIAAAAIPFLRSRSKTEAKSTSSRPSKASSGSGQSSTRSASAKGNGTTKASGAKSGAGRASSGSKSGTAKSRSRKSSTAAKK